MAETRRYRLPEQLGGGEIEATEIWGGCAGGRPEYRIAGLRIDLTMPEGRPLDLVPPPIPPEPEPGAYLIGGRIAVWPKGDNTDLHWWTPGDHVLEEVQHWFTWPLMVDHCGGPDVRIVHLVPAPEPVELPWEGHSTYFKLVVAVGYREVEFAAGAYRWPVRVSVAREFAAALLSAADRAEVRDDT